jgi:uncharacterized membrane protein
MPKGSPQGEGATMSDPNPSGLSDNAAGGIAYITIIPAIVFLIIDPFKKSSFVRFHAWQSIFFFVAWAVIDILVSVVQNLVPSSVFLTLTALQLVGLALFVVWLIVFIGAFNGKRIKLPVIGGLAEKQADR